MSLVENLHWFLAAFRVGNEQLEAQHGMGVKGKARRQRLGTHMQEALVEDRKMQDILATSGSQPMCCRDHLMYWKNPLEM